MRTSISCLLKLLFVCQTEKIDFITEEHVMYAVAGTLLWKLCNVNEAFVLSDLMTHVHKSQIYTLNK